ncbi:unnamed protein product [Hydatigera taeniaeformis]|uniref:Uncharacterized protein n=1 Tax=Hydatigena taeniaeformis TaxID=6205 RepID=A0A0R3WQX4_HYDTA|nr:unnamed protein product [Hydatigera taeniaeformis]
MALLKETMSVCTLVTTLQTPQIGERHGRRCGTERRNKGDVEEEEEEGESICSTLHLSNPIFVAQTQNMNGPGIELVGGMPSDHIQLQSIMPHFTSLQVDIHQLAAQKKHVTLSPRAHL